MTLQEKFIILVDNDRIGKSDAIILLEGDGLNRIPKSAELYKSGFADKIVFSGGITNLPYGSIPFSEGYPALIDAGVPPEAIIHESKSMNTKEQATEVIKLALQNHWKKLILVASNYHQYRAYLTFLREVIDTGSKVILYNAPARELNWFEESGWGVRYDLLDQEFERIENYGKLGHLASLEEAITYQKWKEQQA
jgi:uncharacterized SAM-binding protein YcdF (DUF218 family)